jgi:hypothetical protein
VLYLQRPLDRIKLAWCTLYVSGTNSIS